MSEMKKPETHDEVLRGKFEDPLFVKQEWQGRGVDLLLQWLVNHTNGNVENQHAITLTVGGNLVSGMLISADAYFIKWADLLSADFSSDDGSAESMKKKVLDWNKVPETDDGTLPPSQFIHLEEAEIFSSNGRPILSGGSLWRGKLSSVDGFNLGRMQYQEG